MKHYRKSQRCFVCGKQTFGVFNPAKNLIERLKLEEEGKTYKEADSDEELNNLELIMQPSGSTTSKPTGATADVEEPVTEIEHIHYADDGVVANDTDSDDDSDWEKDHLFRSFYYSRVRIHYFCDPFFLY